MERTKMACDEKFQVEVSQSYITDGGYHVLGLFEGNVEMSFHVDGHGVSPMKTGFQFHDSYPAFWHTLNEMCLAEAFELLAINSL